MKDRNSATGTIFNLAPYLTAENETQAEQHLAQIITEQIGPLVKDIVKYRIYSNAGGDINFHNFEIDDVYGEVLIKVIKYLREQRGRHNYRPLDDFRGYVSVMATNACHEYFRRKYPERSRLRLSLQYLLSHHKDFALWRSEKKIWLCGFRYWCGTSTHSTEESLKDKISRCGILPPFDGEAQRNPAESLRFLFNVAAMPVSIDLLVDNIAEMWHVKDTQLKSYDANPLLCEVMADSGVGPQAACEQKLLLKHLWGEICLLPQRQRIALLLNLRNGQGRSMLALLPALGVATTAQINQALDIPLHELAEMWEVLPMDDNTIAARLGATRQQVIKLRRAARERLARRLAPKPVHA